MANRFCFHFHFDSSSILSSVIIFFAGVGTWNGYCADCWCWKRLSFVVISIFGFFCDFHSFSRYLYLCLFQTWSILCSLKCLNFRSQKLWRNVTHWLSSSWLYCVRNNILHQIQTPIIHSILDICYVYSLKWKQNCWMFFFSIERKCFKIQYIYVICGSIDSVSFGLLFIWFWSGFVAIITHRIGITPKRFEKSDTFVMHSIRLAIRFRPHWTEEREELQN